MMLQIQWPLQHPNPRVRVQGVEVGRVERYPNALLFVWFFLTAILLLTICFKYYCSATSKN